MFSHKVLKNSNLERYTLPSLEAHEFEGEVSDRVDMPPEPPPDPEAIEREARQKAVQIEKDAREQGFKAGLVEGQKSYEEKAALLIGQLSGMITQLGELRERQTREAEPQLLALAIGIAKKVLYAEISINPEIIVGLVKEGINRLEKMGQITIKIHPALHELFLKKMPEFHELHVDVVLDIDPSLPVNGPLVVGPVEEVVINIDELLMNTLEDMRQNLAAH
ncbi:MAG: hypothetical protein HQK98_00620 [Nitrospirae bacterium]|nr:hypothetical protein [Nitrospirota bacterium]